MKAGKIFTSITLITASILLAYCSALMSYIFYTQGLIEGTKVFQLTALLVITLEVSKYLLAVFRFVFNGKVKHIVGLLLNILLTLSIIASVNYFMLDTKGYSPATDFVILLEQYFPINAVSRHLTLLLNVSLSLIVETLVIKFPQLVPNIWGKVNREYEPFFARITKKMLTYYANKIESYVDRKVNSEINPEVKVSKKELTPEVKVSKKELTPEVKVSKKELTPEVKVSKKELTIVRPITEYVNGFNSGEILPSGKLQKKFGLSNYAWEKTRKELIENNLVIKKGTKLEVV